jgi:hypothetical protein
VNNHPPNGACFKITYLKRTDLPTYVSTNNDTTATTPDPTRRPTRGPGPPHQLAGSAAR